MKVIHNLAFSHFTTICKFIKLSLILTYADKMGFITCFILSFIIHFAIAVTAFFYPEAAAVAQSYEKSEIIFSLQLGLATVWA